MAEVVIYAQIDHMHSRILHPFLFIISHLCQLMFSPSPLLMAGVTHYNMSNY